MLQLCLFNDHGWLSIKFFYEKVTMDVDKDIDELVDVNHQNTLENHQNTLESSSRLVQAGSKPNSPGAKVTNSADASTVATKPSSPSKSIADSKQDTQLGVRRDSNTSSPIRRDTNLANSPSGNHSPRKSPVKSPLKASSPTAAHSDEEDIFKFLDLSKSSPPKRAAVPLQPSLQPSTSTVAATSSPPKTKVLEHVSDAFSQNQLNEDRLLWEKQAHVFENQLLDIASQLKALQAEKKELTDKLSKQSQENELLKSRLNEKEAILGQITSEKHDANLRIVQVDQERQVLYLESHRISSIYLLMIHFERLLGAHEFHP